MRLLDLPAAVLGKIVGALADHGATCLVQLCLTCRAGAALAEHGACAAVSRRGDAEISKSARPEPSGSGGPGWVRLLHELQLLGSPTFTKASPDIDIRFPSHYEFPRGSPGSQAVNVAGQTGIAVCGAAPMVTGVHYVEFTIAELAALGCVQLGVVCSNQIDRLGQSDWATVQDPDNPAVGILSLSSDIKCWMCDSEDGSAFSNSGHVGDWTHSSWAGQEEFSMGDRVGLLLDLGNADQNSGEQRGAESSSGTLAVYQDDERLGMMVQPDQGLTPPLYWCARFMFGQARIWVNGKPAPKVTAADLLEDERKRTAVQERRERHALGDYSDDDPDDHV
jgi:hypothetical protein